jgi:hypothetical protein
MGCYMKYASADFILTPAALEFTENTEIAEDQKVRRLEENLQIVVSVNSAGSSEQRERA